MPRARTLIVALIPVLACLSEPRKQPPDEQASTELDWTNLDEVERELSRRQAVLDKRRSEVAAMFAQSLSDPYFQEQLFEKQRQLDLEQAALDAAMARLRAERRGAQEPQ